MLPAQAAGIFAFYVHKYSNPPSFNRSLSSQVMMDIQANPEMTELAMMSNVTARRTAGATSFTVIKFASPRRSSLRFYYCGQL